jgi:hypothetical protein
MAGVHLGTWLHPDSILKGFVQEPKPNGLIQMRHSIMLSQLQTVFWCGFSVHESLPRQL